jgi:hypothetical protein
MIDIHELLRMKEDEIVRVRKEIEALHVVAQMLSDSDLDQTLRADFESAEAPFPIEANATQQEFLRDEPQPADTLSEALPVKRSLRDWFSRAAGD